MRDFCDGSCSPFAMLYNAHFVMCQSCWGLLPFSYGPRTAFSSQKCIIQDTGSLGSCFQRAITLCIRDLEDGFWIDTVTRKQLRYFKNWLLTRASRVCSAVTRAFWRGVSVRVSLPGCGVSVRVSLSGCSCRPLGLAPGRSPSAGRVGGNSRQRQMAVWLEPHQAASPRPQAL